MTRASCRNVERLAIREHFKACVPLKADKSSDDKLLVHSDSDDQCGKEMPRN
jgi:hypothetical protein